MTKATLPLGTLLGQNVSTVRTVASEFAGAGLLEPLGSGFACLLLGHLQPRYNSHCYS